MKATITFLCCFIFVNLVIGDDTINFEEILNKCQTEVGATDEELQTLKDKKIPTTRTGFCLLTCLYENNGFIKNGKFDVESVIKAASSADPSMADKIPKEVLNGVTNDCKDIKNDDKCLLAKDIITCVAESANRRVHGEL